MSDETLEAGFYKLYLDFLAENNVTIGVTPYATAQLLKVGIFFFFFSNFVRIFETVIKNNCFIQF
jgi:hypothetical protein